MLDHGGWTILTTTTGILGFDASLWMLDTTNFDSSPNWTGSFSISQAGNDLLLTYTVPEPSAAAMLLGALGLWLVRIRHRHRRLWTGISPCDASE